MPRNERQAGRPFRLTADSTIGEFYPSWSPDGGSIIYSTWRDGEGGAVRRVVVMHRHLGRPSPSERLTSDTALYFHTAVAPDGKRFVAVRASLSTDRVLRPQVDPTRFDLTLIWVPVEAVGRGLSHRWPTCSRLRSATPSTSSTSPPIRPASMSDLDHGSGMERLRLRLPSWGESIRASLAVTPLTSRACSLPTGGAHSLRASTLCLSSLCRDRGHEARKRWTSTGREEPYRTERRLLIGGEQH